MGIHKELANIQKKIAAPKTQTNSFGGYKYRSCGDILEAIKPLLGDLSLILSDEIINIGDRFYVKATAILTDDKEVIQSTSLAREPEIKKGMDPSQITGAASSYARKYALSGLFAIDDTKDADATNKHHVVSDKETDDIFHKLREEVAFCDNMDDLKLLAESEKFQESKQILRENAPKKLRELIKVRDETIKRIKKDEESPSPEA